MELSKRTSAKSTGKLPGVQTAPKKASPEKEKDDSVRPLSPPVKPKAMSTREKESPHSPPGRQKQKDSAKAPGKKSKSASTASHQPRLSSSTPISATMSVVRPIQFAPVVR